MIYFNLIIKAIISASVLYLVVNSIFRFHLFTNLFLFVMFLAYLIILIIYSDLPYSPLFVYLLGAITLIFGAIYGYFKYKKNEYYIFFNIGKVGYHRVGYFLKLNNSQNVNYKYEKKTFFLINFRNNSSKDVYKLLKGLEKAENKRKISFTMINYWQIIIYVVMMIILWRF
jgi:hypothetical protein